MAVHQDPITKKWYYNYTEKGTRKHIIKKGFKKKTDAEDAEYERRHADNESSVDDKNYTLYQVIEEKIEECRGTYADSSYDSMVSAYNLYIKNRLKDKKIKDYSRIEITRFLNKLLDEGCSKHTVNKAHALLSLCFNYATSNHYILFNPIVGMKRKKIKKKDIPYWTYEEYKKAMEYEKNEDYKIYWEFCMHTGIRKGERVITWRDINFNKKTIKINKHIYDSGTPENRNSIKEGRKNNDGIVITLDKILEKKLEDYKDYCKKFDGFSEDWYVFGRLKPLSRTTIARKLDNLCEVAKVPRITPHGFRHSCVSLAYQAGLEDQIIASRIGDSVEQIHRTYGHLRKGADKPVANCFEQAEENYNKNHKNNEGEE